MAGSIQGLTVIINGDATRLTKAMREARAEAGILKGHMSQIGRLLTFDPTSMTLLTRRQQLLNESILQTSARLQTLRSSYAQLAPTVSTMTSAQLRQFESLQREITATELRMAELRQEAVRTGAAGSLAMQQWAARFGSVSASLSALSSRLMAVSAVAGIVGLASLTAAKNFESSFAGVRKTIIATEAEYQKLAADSIALSLVKPVDANDINRIMELGGQLNIASQYLTKFAGVMADLNVSTDMGIDEGSLKLAQFINITGMAQNDVDRLGATIVDLGNNSATTENQIMLMAMRIAGASSNLGMSAQNTLALAASLSAVGIQAEMGGNAIATIMNKINKDVAADNAALSTWAETAGMSASEFKQAWSNDVTGTLLQIFKGMGQFREEGNNLNVLLKDMGISYMRQVDTLQRLSRASDLTTTLMARSNVAWEQNTALVREATQRYSTAESKLQLMKNSISALGITLGNEILPAFSNIVTGIAQAVQAFADMDDGVKEAVVGFIALAAAAAPIAKVLSLMAGGVSAAMRGFMSLKTAMTLAAAGQLTYTNMTIASSAATSAETAARAANIAITAQQQRSYSILLASKAAEAAASGNNALASMHEASAKALEAMAAGNEAKAEELNTVATLSNAGAKGVLAAATEFATASTLPFAAALAMTNAELLAVTAVIAGLVIATTAFARSVGKANDPLDRLSATYADQQAHVQQLRAEYDQLASSESATAEEVWKAQSALDAESASLEANSVTVREFYENVRRMNEEQADLAVKSDDAMRAAQDEAGSIDLLVDKIRELAPAAKDNSDSMQDLLLAISQINMLVPELELSFDSTTGVLQSAAGAWDEVALAAGRAKVNATAFEQLNTWTLQQNKDQNALAESTRNLDSTFNMTIDELNAMRDSGIYLGAEFDDLVQTHNDLAYATGESRNRVKEYSEEVKRTIDTEAAYRDVIGQVEAGKIKLAEASDYLSKTYAIEATQEEILAYNEMRVANAEQQVAKSSKNVAEELQKAYEKNETFASVLNNSGVSLEALSAKMAGFGYNAEEVAKSVEDVFNKTADGLNEIEVNAEVTLDKLFETLEHNREVTANWSTNLKGLYDIAGADYHDYIDYLRSLGPEYAQVVQDAFDKANESYESFAADADRWREIILEDSKSSLRQFGIEADEVVANAAVLADEMAKSNQNIELSTSDMMTYVLGAWVKVKDGSTTQMQAAMEALAQAIADGRAPGEASKIAAAIMSNLQVGDTTWIGRQAADGVRQGLEEGLGAIEAAAAAIANTVATVSAAKLAINSPSRVMRNIYRSVGEGAELGILDGMDDVRRATGLLASAAIPEASTIALGVRAQAASANAAALSAQSVGGTTTSIGTIQMNLYQQEGESIEQFADLVVSNIQDLMSTGA